MGNPPHDPPADSFHVHAGESGKDRDELDRIFKAGVEARRARRSLHDNPFAAGCEEREEWAAGWKAKPEIDDEDEPNAGYQEN